MRPTPARLVLTVALAASISIGCANRGMLAPSDGSAKDGSKSDGAGGAGKSDGGGSDGSGGTSGTDASCGLLTDALFDHSTTLCDSTFNFEGGTAGATLPVGTQLAFTNLIQSASQTYCGTGALAVSASFSGTTGNSTKGEVDLPLGTDGGTTSNLAGKTLTVHVSANPACAADLKLTVALITASGQPQFPLRNLLVTANWTTASATLSADGGVDSVLKIALEVSSFSGYHGTIYFDEIDLR